MPTKVIVQRFKGQVHCPICTRNVEAEVEQIAKKTRVVPGQKCPRCMSTLDVAAVLQVQVAA
ncbi:MAG TPA: hypothetical protein VMT32_18345 [Bryobacteraceae bacterium]|nr:hypothetical protein [Bryobacteraceae bacterium]